MTWTHQRPIQRVLFCMWLHLHCRTSSAEKSWKRTKTCTSNELITCKSTANTTVMLNKITPVFKREQIAEIKLAGFLTEYNISFKAADHSIDLIKDQFSDSHTAKNCLSKGQTSIV